VSAILRRRFHKRKGGLRLEGKGSDNSNCLVTGEKGGKNTPRGKKKELGFYEHKQEKKGGGESNSVIST